MALRASTMIRRTEQVLRSPQSSQGRNAVTEAHWNWGQRTIESAHDRADPDLMGRASESVSAAFAFLGIDEAGVPELGQDMIEKLFRNRIGFGDVRDLSQIIRLQSRQMDHGLEAILPLLREHNLILIFGRERCLLDERHESASSPNNPANPRRAAYIGRRTENTKTTRRRQPALRFVAYRAHRNPH